MIPSEITDTDWVGGYIEFENSFIEIEAPANYCGNFIIQLPPGRHPFQFNRLLPQGMSPDIKVAAYIRSNKENDRQSQMNCSLRFNTGIGVDGLGKWQAADRSMFGNEPISGFGGIALFMFLVPQAFLPRYEWVDVQFEASGPIGNGGKFGNHSINNVEHFDKNKQWGNLYRRDFIHEWAGRIPTTNNQYGSDGTPYTVGLFFESNAGITSITQSPISFRYNYTVPEIVQAQPTTAPGGTVNGNKALAFGQARNPYLTNTPVTVGDLYDFGSWMVPTATHSPDFYGQYPIIGPTMADARSNNYDIHTTNVLPGIYEARGTSLQWRASFNDPAANAMLDEFGAFDPTEDFSNVTGNYVADIWSYPSTTSSPIAQMTCHFAYVQDFQENINAVSFGYVVYTTGFRWELHNAHDIPYSSYDRQNNIIVADHINTVPTPIDGMFSATYTFSDLVAPTTEYTGPGYIGNMTWGVIEGSTSAYQFPLGTKVSETFDLATLIRTVVYEGETPGIVGWGTTRTTVTSKQVFDPDSEMAWYQPPGITAAQAVTQGVPTTVAASVMAVIPALPTF